MYNFKDGRKSGMNVVGIGEDRCQLVLTRRVRSRRFSVLAVEWSIAAVLKTVELQGSGGGESLSPPESQTPDLTLCKVGRLLFDGATQGWLLVPSVRSGGIRM